MRWSGTFAKAAVAMAALTLGASVTTVAANGQAAASTTSGSPVTIVGIGPYSGSAAYNYPDEQDAISLYFNTLNKHGGINGHPVHVVFCTEQGDPNVARSCALQAVSDKADAVITSSNVTESIDPILQQNHIPFLVQSIATPSDGSDSYAFPIDAGTVGTSTALGVALAKTGCKSVGSIYVSGVPTVADILNDAQLALKKQGLSGIPTNLKIGISGTQATLQAQVAQLESNGAGCILPVMAPAQGVALEQAIATSNSPHLPVAAFCSVFSPAQLQQLGSSAQNIVLACGGHLPTDTKIAGVKSVDSSMKKAYPGVQLTNFTLADWAMAEIVAGAAKSVHGTVTPASLYKSLSNMTGFSTNGLLPPWTTSKKPIAVGGMHRVFNPAQSVWKINAQGAPVYAYSVNSAVSG